MFTKHFYNFLLWFQTQSCIGVKDVIFLNRYNTVLVRKKRWWILEKGTQTGILYIIFLSACLWPAGQVCPLNWEWSPKPSSSCPVGTIHLPFLPSEFSDLGGICVLLPAKVFYWLELMSTGAHLKASLWVSQIIQMQLLGVRGWRRHYRRIGVLRRHEVWNPPPTVDLNIPQVKANLKKKKKEKIP